MKFLLLWLFSSFFSFLLSSSAHSQDVGMMTITNATLITKSYVRVFNNTDITLFMMTPHLGARKDTLSPYTGNVIYVPTDRIYNPYRLVFTFWARTEKGCNFLHMSCMGFNIHRQDDDKCYLDKGHYTVIINKGIREDGQYIFTEAIQVDSEFAAYARNGHPWY